LARSGLEELQQHTAATREQLPALLYMALFANPKT